MKPGSRPKRADLIFAAEDPFHNIVRLERFTWENHIVPGHPEVEDTKVAVLKRIVETPDTVHRSAAAADCAIFQGSNLVAVVMYETEDFASSAQHRFTFGRIATVYPQPIHRAKLLGILYSKREAAKTGSP